MPNQEQPNKCPLALLFFLAVLARVSGLLVVSLCRSSLLIFRAQVAFLPAHWNSYAIEGAKNPLIISSKEHSFLCRDAVSKLGLETRYIFEEIGRNTGPAIYMAALASHSNDTLLIMPSDHWIDDSEGFANMAAAGEEVAADRRWAIWSPPDAPATGYGYINTNCDVPV